MITKDQPEEVPSRTCPCACCHILGISKMTKLLHVMLIWGITYEQLVIIWRELTSEEEKYVNNIFA